MVENMFKGKCEDNLRGFYSTTHASDCNPVVLFERGFEKETSCSLKSNSEKPQPGAKRRRNRTIDYHSLPSLYWEGTVKEYYEKKYSEPETVETEAITEEKLNNQDEQKKPQDGLTLILQRQI